MEMQNKVTVVIPNFNGILYLQDCLEALYQHKKDSFMTILVDNGSTDGSREMVEELFPQVQIIRFQENLGFCKAVNEGIRQTKTPYVILLNNDTRVLDSFIEELVAIMDTNTNVFSASAKMLVMNQPDVIDDCGDLYCSFGYAVGRGKGKKAIAFGNHNRSIFASCGGAAIYRMSMLEKTGLLDENHFAYLEDIDLGYRGKILGFKNIFCEKAKVLHAGSGYSGSRYNEFKIKLSGKNNIYLIYKNMPFLQILLNLPFLILGIVIKWLFFLRKGYGLLYLKSIYQGIAFCSTKKAKENKVPFKIKNCINYVTIQLELWWNIVRILFE